MAAKFFQARQLLSESGMLFVAIIITVGSVCVLLWDTVYVIIHFV